MHNSEISTATDIVCVVTCPCIFISSSAGRDDACSKNGTFHSSYINRYHFQLPSVISLFNLLVQGGSYPTLIPPLLMFKYLFDCFTSTAVYVSR